jgi:hypothetical protein
MGRRKTVKPAESAAGMRKSIGDSETEDILNDPTIMKHLYEMRTDPFKGDVIRLKPPLQRLFRKRIGNDRLFFSNCCKGMTDEDFFGLTTHRYTRMRALGRPGHGCRGIRGFYQ